MRRANEYKNEVLGTVAHDLQESLERHPRPGRDAERAARRMSPVPLDKVKDQLGHIRELGQPD